MNIDIAPETERVVREELSSGHFKSVDELILSTVQAWRERNLTAPTRSESTRRVNLSLGEKPSRHAAALG